MAHQHGNRAEGGDGGGQQGDRKAAYLRLAAMIVTSMVLMYWVMYLGTFEWSHVQWSESRLFMTLAMGGTMALVMLAWMLDMYRDLKMNVAVVVAGGLLLVGGALLDRTQATVQDDAFMSGMIPHHSLAITRAERSELADIRVCELAVKISEAQRREIAEMEWLISDIKENGPAETVEAAGARPIPEFSGDAQRQCSGLSGREPGG